MSNKIKTPDFSSLEVTSLQTRKAIDQGFLVLCVVTSLISLVILAILLSSIILKAIPAFSAHSDNFKNENRMVFFQGDNEGNDPLRLDEGDLVQGVFVTSTLERGGLAESNDTTLDGEQRFVGIYSFEIVSVGEKNAFQLAPAQGEQNVTAIARSIEGIDSSQFEGQSESTSVLLLESSSADFKVRNLKIGDSLVKDGKLAGQISGDWAVKLSCDMSGETSFCKLNLSPIVRKEEIVLDNGKVSERSVASDLMEDINRKTKNRAGYFSGLFNINSHDLGSDAKFKPVKLRNLDDEIALGDIKICNAEPAGLSKRKRKGFNFGGDLDLVYCPTPEADASTGQHVKHFLSETNKSVPSEAGIGPALMGTLWVCVGCGLFALPLGIGTAILLEEFKPVNRYLRWLHTLVQLNITNLAGVPSIVYGILGLTAFAMMFGIFGSAKEPSLELGADHYFQYLTLNDKPVLIPLDPQRKKMAHPFEEIAKKQEELLRGQRLSKEQEKVMRAKLIAENEEAGNGDESQYEDEKFYEVDLMAVTERFDEFDKQLHELVKQIDEEKITEGFKFPQRKNQRLRSLLSLPLAEGDSPDETLPDQPENAALSLPERKLAVAEGANELKTALLELAETIRQPILTDGMKGQTTDGKPLTLFVEEPGDETPQEEETLSVTIPFDTDGGPVSIKRWYYFQLPFGRSVLAASLTLMLVILPVIIIASQEALRAVPSSLRECAMGLGATPWQVVRRVTLPSAVPSIMTGAILSMSRAIGEAAPILIICGILFVSAGPSHLMDLFSILPIQIYNTTKLPVNEEMLIHSQNVAAAGIVVLLAILLTFNGIAIAIRQLAQKPLS